VLLESVSTGMIFHQFPDLQWLKKQSETNFSNRKDYLGRSLPATGWPSVVLNVKSGSIYRDNIRGPLSIFTNVAGSSIVHCDQKRTEIHSGYFYVTNQSQRYTLEIEEKKSAETFNIHFGEHWADEVFQSITNTPDKILDNPIFQSGSNSVALHNVLHSKDSTFNDLLRRLHQCEGNSLREEETQFDILVYLLNQDQQINKKANHLPASKNSTKIELIKRLTNATDYIYSNYHREISLDVLAQATCLSKFHFLRLFKLAFAKTPLQFINEVKIVHAKELLQNPTLEVRDVARSLGFSNSSSFSRLFYNQVGAYPSQVR
jgi:AraC family transcriptional regulator